jgi:hypothetical protein
MGSKERASVLGADIKYLKNITGSVPDHCKKASIAIRQVT